MFRSLSTTADLLCLSLEVVLLCIFEELRLFVWLGSSTGSLICVGFNLPLTLHHKMDYTEDNCLAYRLFRTTGYEEGTPGTLRWLHHCTTAVWKIQQRLTWAMQSWGRTCHIVREQWNTWSRFAVPLSVLSSSPLPLLSLSNQTLQSVCIQCLPTGSLGSSTECLSALASASPACRRVLLAESQTFVVNPQRFEEASMR